MRVYRALLSVHTAAAAQETRFNLSSSSWVDSCAAAGSGLKGSRAAGRFFDNVAAWVVGSWPMMPLRLGLYILSVCVSVCVCVCACVCACVEFFEWV